MQELISGRDLSGRECLVCPSDPECLPSEKGDLSRQIPMKSVRPFLTLRNNVLTPLGPRSVFSFYNDLIAGVTTRKTLIQPLRRRVLVLSSIGVQGFGLGT